MQKCQCQGRKCTLIQHIFARGHEMTGDNRNLGIHWEDLELVFQVFQCGGVKPAADALRLDISTVRRRLRTIEQELGYRLFEVRAGKSIVTADGEALVDVAMRMDKAASELRGARIDQERDIHGSIRVSTMEGFGAWYLASALAQMQAQHADLQVELVTAHRPLSLDQRETDLSIEMVRPSTGAFRVRLLGTYDVGLYGAVEYLAGHGTPTSVDGLARHRFVGYVPELALMEVKWLDEWVPQVKLHFASTSLAAQLHAAASGAGLCALPAFMAEGNPSLVRVLLTQPPVTRQWWLVTRASDHMVKRVKAVAQYLGAIVERDRSRLSYPPLAAAASLEAVQRRGP